MEKAMLPYQSGLLSDNQLSSAPIKVDDNYKNSLQEGVQAPGVIESVKNKVNKYSSQDEGKESCCSKIKCILPSRSTAIKWLKVGVVVLSVLALILCFLNPFGAVVGGIALGVTIVEGLFIFFYGLHKCFAWMGKKITNHEAIPDNSNPRNFDNDNLFVRNYEKNKNKPRGEGVIYDDSL